MLMEEAAPQTQVDDDVGSPPTEEPEEPWARLIGMGPTSSFGIVDLNPRVVEFGKVAKNSSAHIKFDDPRVRQGGPLAWRTATSFPPPRSP